MGSSTEHSAFGPTHNPWDLDAHPRRLGRWLGRGASPRSRRRSRSAPTPAARSASRPRSPGTVGVKPTYGGVSRYGLVALASSLDQAGPVRPHRARRRAAARRCSPGTTRSTRPRSTRRCRTSWRPRAPATCRGMRVGVVQQFSGEGYQPGVEQRFREAVAAARGAGRDGRRGRLPALRLRPARLLPDPAERVLVEPRPLRRDALRPAGRRRRHGQRRGGHVGQPRRGLRHRGEAAHHARHVRAVQRLLRRLLRAGAEGAHADRARLRGGVRAGRRARLADDARPRRSRSASGSTTRWRCTSPTCAPSRPTSPATPSMSLPVGLAPEDGLPVGLQVIAPAAGRRPALPRRRRAGGGARRPLGPPADRRGTRASPRPPMETAR